MPKLIDWKAAADLGRAEASLRLSSPLSPEHLAEGWPGGGRPAPARKRALRRAPRQWLPGISVD